MSVDVAIIPEGRGLGSAKWHQVAEPRLNLLVVQKPPDIKKNVSIMISQQSCKVDQANQALI